MAKKRAKKKKLTKSELDEQLIENFIKLQKVQTNLAVKFDDLSQNISRLLELFEMSAKSFMEKQDSGTDNDLLGKLDTLVDQNKTIAKGLTLMEEKIRHKVEEKHEHSPRKEAELHGFYPSNLGDRPRPGSSPKF